MAQGMFPWAILFALLRCQRQIVPLTQLFSNSFLRDLDKIWALREYIPDLACKFTKIALLHLFPHLSLTFYYSPLKIPKKKMVPLLASWMT